MPITSSPFSSSMPFTPVVSRPISRTSLSWNRMLIPSLGGQHDVVVAVA